MFDNAESEDIIDAYMPHGGSAVGHVLITSRRSFSNCQRVSLECFTPTESLDFLVHTVGQHALEVYWPPGERRRSQTGVAIGLTLSDSLGHLPLALAMAAGYIQRCDVTCKEYYVQLQEKGGAVMPGNEADPRKLAAYPMGVRESLMLSLVRIESEESSEAQSIQVRIRTVVNCLAFLAPDGITRALFRQVAQQLRQAAPTCSEQPDRKDPWMRAEVWMVISAVAAVACLMLVRRRTSTLFSGRSVLAGALLITSVGRLICKKGPRPTTPPPSPGQIVASERRLSSDIDRVWMSLKEYSLLSVRERVGSMHRLLQELLRVLQPEHQAAQSLACCISALVSAWAFDPADTGSWAACGALLEHVKVVGRHTGQLLDRQSASPVTADVAISAAELLTEAALYMSMALSQFEEADNVLDQALEMYRVRNSSDSRHTAALALTLHTRGKVARYRNKFEDAAKNLAEALSIRRALCKVSDLYKWDVASSLHELGVLQLKMSQPEQAESLLLESLTMQRALKAREITPKDAQKQRFADESATLHQLAVTAMLSKPARLDEADDLLQQALAIGSSGNPFARGARAASLQQLARVLTRRGNLDEARAHLEDALGLYGQAYGTGTPHVNVALVKTQLAKVCCSLGLKSEEHEACVLFEEASGHLLDALRIQQRLYGAGSIHPTSTDIAHSDIAATLGQLGTLERSRKSLPKAQQYFTQQREMIVQLLFLACGLQFQEGKPLQCPPPNDSHSLQLCKQLLSVLQWERTVARDLKQNDQAQLHAASIKHLTHALNRTSSESNQLEQASLVDPKLCAECLACWRAVRQALMTAKATHAPLDLGQVQAAAADLLTGIQEFERRERRERGEALSSLHGAALEFYESLHASNDQGAAGEAYDVQHYWVACDTIRNAFRKVGCDLS